MAPTPRSSSQGPDAEASPGSGGSVRSVLGKVAVVMGSACRCGHGRCCDPPWCRLRVRGYRNRLTLRTRSGWWPSVLGWRSSGRACLVVDRRAEVATRLADLGPVVLHHEVVVAATSRSLGCDERKCSSVAGSQLLGALVGGDEAGELRFEPDGVAALRVVESGD